MTDFKIIQEITASNPKKEEIVVENYDSLSDEEVEQLVLMIRDTLSGSHQEMDKDAVREVAYNMIEDIPGLEMPEAQHAAVDKIVKDYFKK